jgi:hypothetical protein
LGPHPARILAAENPAPAGSANLGPHPSRPREPAGRRARPAPTSARPATSAFAPALPDTAASRPAPPSGGTSVSAPTGRRTRREERGVLAGPGAAAQAREAPRAWALGPRVPPARTTAPGSLPLRSQHPSVCRLTDWRAESRGLVTALGPALGPRCPARNGAESASRSESSSRTASSGRPPEGFKKDPPETTPSPRVEPDARLWAQVGCPHTSAYICPRVTQGNRLRYPVTPQWFRVVSVHTVTFSYAEGPVQCAQVCGIAGG